MNYKLAKKLKDAGFPFDWCDDKSPCLMVDLPDEYDCYPTLSELIDSCGEIFLDIGKEDCIAYDGFPGNYDDNNVKNEGRGKTPEESVAKLWFKLNEKK